MRKLIYILLFIPFALYGQGAEMINNGNFADSAKWNLQYGSWDIQSGTANFLDDGNQPIRQMEDSMVAPVLANTEYILTFHISNCDRYPYTDLPYFRIQSTDGVANYVLINSYREDKTHELIFTTPADVSDGGISFYARNSRGSFSIDSISLKTTEAIGSQPYYIAPDGNNADPGDIANPWRTMQRAFQIADAGDTVFFRDGVYYLEGTQTINPKGTTENAGVYTDSAVTPYGNLGTAGNRIVFMSYPSEWAIFDGRNLCDWLVPNTSDEVYNTAIDIQYTSYMTLKDFEVRNVYQCDTVLSSAVGTYRVVQFTWDHLVIHNIGMRGTVISSGARKLYYDNGYTTDPPYSAFEDVINDTLRFINCDIYDLCDTLTGPGNGADAWYGGIIIGNTYIWDGCRVWNFTDDGWNFDASGGGTRMLNNNWTMPSNKYAHIPDYNGEGNGAKVGGPFPITQDWSEYNSNYLLATNNLAVYAPEKGFQEITINRGIYANNTVAYCSPSFFSGSLIIYTDSSYAVHRNDIKYRNNLSCFVTENNAYGEPYHIYAPGRNYPESHNTWDLDSLKLGGTPTDSVEVSAADFYYNVADSATIVSLFTASRASDGSLPDNPFRLAPTSDLINAGREIADSDSVNTDLSGAGIDMTYYGSAPDIGAFEYIPPTAYPASISNGRVHRLNNKTMIIR